MCFYTILETFELLVLEPLLKAVSWDCWCIFILQIYLDSFTICWHSLCINPTLILIFWCLFSMHNLMLFLELMYLCYLCFTVHARIVQNTKDRLVLNCTISGFDSNLPTIDYDWTLNDSYIPHPHDKALAAASVYSPADLARSLKFVVSLDVSELSLTVNNPSMFLGMFFFCYFCYFVISILIVVRTCPRPCVAAKPRAVKPPCEPNLAAGHTAKPRPCEPAAKPRHVAALL